MPWKRDLTPIEHISVVSLPYVVQCDKATRTLVDVKCPMCETIRPIAIGDMRREMKRSNFHGYCRPCSFKAIKSGIHRWFNGKPGGRADSRGYMLTTINKVPNHLLPMYRAMQRCGQPVLEHRWVIACHLGRALLSSELIDHRNGKKADNRIENLRIYIRGKNQPGSTNGYGTYYHEWQMAEAKIKKLEMILCRIPELA